MALGFPIKPLESMEMGNSCCFCHQKEERLNSAFCTGTDERAREVFHRICWLQQRGPTLDSPELRTKAQEELFAEAIRFSDPEGVEWVRSVDLQSLKDLSKLSGLREMIDSDKLLQLGVLLKNGHLAPHHIEWGIRRVIGSPYPNTRILSLLIKYHPNAAQWVERSLQEDLLPSIRNRCKELYQNATNFDHYYNQMITLAIRFFPDRYFRNQILTAAEEKELSVQVILKIARMVTQKINILNFSYQYYRFCLYSILDLCKEHFRDTPVRCCLISEIQQQINTCFAEKDKEYVRYEDEGFKLETIRNFMKSAQDQMDRSVEQSMQKFDLFFKTAKSFLSPTATGEAPPESSGMDELSKQLRGALTESASVRDIAKQLKLPSQIERMLFDPLDELQRKSASKGAAEAQKEPICVPVVESTKKQTGSPGIRSTEPIFELILPPDEFCTVREVERSQKQMGMSRAFIRKRLHAMQYVHTPR